MLHRPVEPAPVTGKFGQLADNLQSRDFGEFGRVGPSCRKPRFGELRFLSSCKALFSPTDTQSQIRLVSQEDSGPGSAGTVRANSTKFRGSERRGTSGFVAEVEGGAGPQLATTVAVRLRPHPIRSRLGPFTFTLAGITILGNH